MSSTLFAKRRKVVSKKRSEITSSLEVIESVQIRDFTTKEEEISWSYNRISLYTYLCLCVAFKLSILECYPTVAIKKFWGLLEFWMSQH